MEIFQNFSSLFIQVWNKGILGVDIFPVIHQKSNKKIYVSLEDIND